jgi:hypothetical protein
MTIYFMHFCSHKILILLTLDMKITRWFKNGFLLYFSQPTLQGAKWVRRIF